MKKPARDVPASDTPALWEETATQTKGDGPFGSSENHGELQTITKELAPSNIPRIGLNARDDNKAAIPLKEGTPLPGSSERHQKVSTRGNSLTSHEWAC